MKGSSTKTFQSIYEVRAISTKTPMS